MKKIIAVLLSAILTGWVSSPAHADIQYIDDPGWVGQQQSASSWSNVSVTGSIQEGGTYRVGFTADLPAGSVCMVRYAISGSLTPEVFSQTGTVSYDSGNLIAQSAGSVAEFWAIYICTNQTTNQVIGFASRRARVTFEVAPAVGAVTNFSVVPQAVGTAFTTWGIASGATSYTATATPGGQSCTTTDNFCTISGLTEGQTYTFSVVGKNGNNVGPTATSGPVLIKQPVTVAVALNGGTWKVGETVTAQVVVQGSSATPQITWYRCNNPVGTMPVAPAPSECTTISSGSSATYKLATPDIGKYITANAFINGTDPQGQMTANSNTAVLASSAVIPTPTPAPDGSPTIVGIPNRIVPITGGTQITITGTGLAGVTSVTIGGVVAEVVTKSDTSLIVKVPTSSQTGAVDLVITNAKGTVTEKSAVIYSSTQTPVTPITPVTPVITKITKTLSVTSFTASQIQLSTAQKAAVKKLIAANPTLTQLSCVAKTTGKSVTSKDLSNAKARATAACAYAASLRSNLFVKASGSASIGNATSRNVLLSLKN